MFHENYLYSNTEKILSFVDVVKVGELDKKLDKKEDIIAVGSYVHGPAIINYCTDFSCVYFNVNTIKKLLKEERLQWAFDQFEVTKAVGFDKELNKEIIKSTNIDILDL